jgi:hypothetical protein
MEIKIMKHQSGGGQYILKKGLVHGINQVISPNKARYALGQWKKSLKNGLQIIFKYKK